MSVLKYYNTQTGTWLPAALGDIGPTGPTGAPGNDSMVPGPTGDTGPVGPTGNDGVTGPQGEVGATGPQGELGPTGNDGAVGPTGPQGEVGPTGVPGTDALWNFLGEYSDTPMYAEGDIVTYNGETYRRNGSDNSVTGYHPTVTGYWDKIAERGADGAEGPTGPAGSGGGPTNTIISTNTYYSVSVADDGVVTMVTSRGGLEFGALPEPGGPSHFHIMRPTGQSSDLFFGDDFNYVLQRATAYGQYPAYGVEIGANDNIGGAQQVWRFGTDGTLQLPTTSTINFTHGYVGQNGFSNPLVVSAGDNLEIKTNENGNTWNFGTDGTLTTPGHIVPNADLAYDLGSTSSQWRSIYVGTGTIYIGGVALGVNENNFVTVDGNPIITVNTAGNITVQGDVAIGTVIISDTAPEPSSGVQWFNTVEARTYVAYNEQWVDASPTILAPPDVNPTLESVTFNDNTTQTTAWSGTVSYNDLTDKPVTPAFVGGGGASTWLTAD
jgi:hypothetical protein